MTEHKIEYSDTGRIKSVDGFRIAGDKHAYECLACGAIWQSKNVLCRSIFATDDPRCKKCEQEGTATLDRICKCEPVITGGLT